MGCGVSSKQSIGAVVIEGQSQLTTMTAHLNTLPPDEQSRRKMGMIRLIHKHSFVNHPVFRPWLKRLKKLVDLLEVKAYVEKAQIIGYVHTVSCNSQNDEIQQLLKELTEETECAKIRKELEEVLFWREGSLEADSICQIFDMDSCPSFTFMSHRWAPQGRALGLHNELPLLMALAPQDYIWLDCCCAPQNQGNFECGNTMKVIWNIDLYLDKCTDIISYYFIDGIHRPEIDTSDEFDPLPTKTTTNGLLRLHQCCNGKMFGRNDEIIKNDKDSEDSEDSEGVNQYRVILNQRHEEAGRRLWCCVEKYLGKDKVYVPEKRLFKKDENTQSTPSSSSMNVRDITALQCLNIIRSYGGLSLDCYSATDIPPVTKVMHMGGVLPFYVLPDNRTLACFDCSTETVVPNAICLPVVDQKVPSIFNNGWIWNKITRSYFFQCQWPQNEAMNKIGFQIHKECMEKRNSESGDNNIKSMFLFDEHPGISMAMTIDYYDNPLDVYRTRLHEFPCLFCNGKTEE